MHIFIVFMFNFNLISTLLGPISGKGLFISDAIALRNKQQPYWELLVSLWYPDELVVVFECFTVIKGISMITFTPLSGAARSSRSTPLAYILQVDDVRILLDCGSPDWSPEDSSSSAVKSEDIEETSYHWEEYCRALRECVALFSHRW